MTRLPFIKAFAVAALFAGLPLAATPALAHAELKSAVPAVGATVPPPSPTELKLSFSEPIELAFTKVVVKGEDGQPVDLGKLALDPADASTLVVPIAAPLPTGTITVEWTAVADDGHKSKGSYTLSISN